MELTGIVGASPCPFGGWDTVGEFQGQRYQRLGG
jgi:hypothetical protein